MTAQTLLDLLHASQTSEPRFLAGHDDETVKHRLDWFLVYSDGSLVDLSSPVDSDEMIPRLVVAVVVVVVVVSPVDSDEMVPRLVVAVVAVVVVAVVVDLFQIVPAFRLSKYHELSNQQATRRAGPRAGIGFAVPQGEPLTPLEDSALACENIPILQSELVFALGLP